MVGESHHMDTPKECNFIRVGWRVPDILQHFPSISRMVQFAMLCEALPHHLFFSPCFCGTESTRVFAEYGPRGTSPFGWLVEHCACWRAEFVQCLNLVLTPSHFTKMSWLILGTSKGWPAQAKEILLWRETAVDHIAGIEVLARHKASGLHAHVSVSPVKQRAHPIRRFFDGEHDARREKGPFLIPYINSDKIRVCWGPSSKLINSLRADPRHHITSNYR